jgi:tellurite resistance protein TehA-like permease
MGAQHWRRADRRARRGSVAAVATLVACRATFGIARDATLRTLVAILFAAPAAYAGYHVVLALAQYGVPSENWRQVFALFGAGATGYAAVTRLMLHAT